MRDPRLVEIEFLMDLETAGMLQLRSTHSDDTSGVVRAEGYHRYGLDPFRFRDLVLEMLRRGFADGPIPRMTSDGLHDRYLVQERSLLITQLASGQPPRGVPHASRPSALVEPSRRSPS